MDPAIAGTFPQGSPNAASRRIGNEDGSIDLEVYRIPEEKLPLGLAVFVTSNDRVIWEAGTQLTSNISETRDGGERIYALHLTGSSLPPGYYVAHRFARQMLSAVRGTVQYETFSFVVPDTPFTNSRCSSFRFLDLHLKDVLSGLFNPDNTPGSSNSPCAEACNELVRWKVWE